MKKLTQRELAGKSHISEAYMSQILAGNRRPRWPVAKRIAQAANTPVELWMEGSPDEMREALDSRE